MLILDRIERLFAEESDLIKADIELILDRIERMA